MKYTYQYLEDSWTEHCKYLEDSRTPITIDTAVDITQALTWNLPWDINLNLNITSDVIEEISDNKWDWSVISGNPMEKDKEPWINNHRLQIIKAFQIQRHWRNCVSNPEYKLAQKLLIANFNKK